MNVIAKFVVIAAFLLPPVSAGATLTVPPSLTVVNRCSQDLNCRLLFRHPQQVDHHACQNPLAGPAKIRDLNEQPCHFVLRRNDWQPPVPLGRRPEHHGRWQGLSDDSSQLAV